MSMFKECRLEDMPPHIYAVSNSAYRSMIRTKKDQSIIFIGRSGIQAVHALGSIVTLLK